MSLYLGLRETVRRQSALKSVRAKLKDARSTVKEFEHEHSWTTGDDEDVIHVGLIDRGAASEVHEVNRLLYNHS
jgi:hypothetical protein